MTNRVRIGPHSNRIDRTAMIMARPGPMKSAGDGGTRFESAEGYGGDLSLPLRAEAPRNRARSSAYEGRGHPALLLVTL